MLPDKGKDKLMSCVGWSRISQLRKTQNAKGRDVQWAGQASQWPTLGEKLRHDWAEATILATVPSLRQHQELKGIYGTGMAGSGAEGTAEGYSRESLHHGSHMPSQVMPLVTCLFQPDSPFHTQLWNSLMNMVSRDSVTSIVCKCMSFGWDTLHLNHNTI